MQRANMKFIYRMIVGAGSLADRISGGGFLRGPCYSDAGLLEIQRAFSAGDWRPTANALKAANANWLQRSRLISAVRAAKKPWITAKSWYEIDIRDPEATLVYGLSVRDWAWDARGGGYSSTVSEKAAALFGERLMQALPLLKTAAELSPCDPDPLDGLIWTGMALGAPRKQIQDWFEEGIRRDRWNLDLHHSRLQTLCPKWDGSNEALLQFADQVSASAPPGSDLQALVPMAHYEVAARMSDDSPETESRYWRSKPVADGVILAHRRLLSRDANADTLERIKSRGAFAYAFWQMGAKQAAREEFAFLGKRLPGLMWECSMTPARLFKQARAACR